MHEDPPAPPEELGGLGSLFDDMIQRLFATGLGIEAIAGQLTDPELAARLAQHVADLDDAIEQIRARIMRLRDAAGAGSVPEHGVPSTALARSVVS